MRKMKHLYTQQAQIGACWVTYYWLCYGIKKGTDYLHQLVFLTAVWWGLIRYLFIIC